MVVQYLLVALVAFIASMDEQLFGITMLGRPLFTSLFVGLILGDVDVYKRQALLLAMTSRPPKTQVGDSAAMRVTSAPSERSSPGVAASIWARRSSRACGSSPAR